jgi:nicotinate-nucleotide adenylyltransferase
MNREFAILGGAFDPPHFSHLSIARQVKQHGNVDRVIFMPCWKHMYGKQLSAPEDRLEMCRMTCAGEHNIEVSNLEISQQLSGETFFLVQKLRAIKNLTCSLIIGQDNADSFQNWFRYKDLQQMVKFIVVPRGSTPPTTDSWYLKQPHKFLDIPVKDISSTQIRDFVANNDASFARELVKPDVYSYIISHSLYRGL